MYLYARGMVHKDLRSPNVPVDGGGRAKVSDLGSSGSLHTVAARSAAIGCRKQHSESRFSPQILVRDGSQGFTNLWRNRGGS